MACDLRLAASDGQPFGLEARNPPRLRSHVVVRLHQAIRPLRATSQAVTRAASPIGVYDSGVGGLSVLRALRMRLPQERFVYVADSANAPYGDRDRHFLEARASEIARFMLRQGASALVLACNTVSVVTAQSLRARYAIPIVAMEPAIKPGALATSSKVVLVLATATTIASSAVQRLCRLYAPEVRMMLQACPGLVEQVERGAIEDSFTRALLERYLRPGCDAGADTIVLGCTHYPFLSDQIAQIAGPCVRLIEPSEAIARQLVRVLHVFQIPPAPTLPQSLGATTFYTSGSLAALRTFLASTGEINADVRPLPDEAHAHRPHSQRPRVAGMRGI
jgi:glutamate racemase